jgi:hypothetical protein
MVSQGAAMQAWGSEGMVDRKGSPTGAGLESRTSPLVGCVALSALLLAGCESATAVGNSIGQFGSYVGNQVSGAADFVMGRKSGQLVDDGTACFATERVAYYQAVDDVTAAERAQTAATVGAVGAAVAAVFVDSTVAKVITIGLAATLAAVAISLEEDGARIATVTRTFDDLVACRRREAETINAELKAGTITREAAEQRMARLRGLMQEDLTVAEGTNAILAARTETFAVSAEEAKARSLEQAQAQPAPQPTPTPQATPAPQATPTAQATSAPAATTAAGAETEEKRVEAAIQSNQRALQQQTASIEQAKQLVGEEGGFQLAGPVAPWGIGGTQGAA